MEADIAGLRRVLAELNMSINDFSLRIESLKADLISMKTCHLEVSEVPKLFYFCYFIIIV